MLVTLTEILKLAEEKKCAVGAFNSYMSKAGTNAVKAMLESQDVTFFHDLALAAEKAMQADAEKAMRIFAGL